MYVYGLDLISADLASASGVRFYHADGQLSIRLLTDAAGHVADTYLYDAFGVLIAATGGTANAYLYTGEQFDAETALYYLRARNYDSGTGRFTSTDPFPGFNTDPSSLHRYLYAANDPVNRIDPSGEISFSVSGLLLGALIGFGVFTTGGLIAGNSFRDAIKIGALGAIIGGLLGGFMLGGPLILTFSRAAPAAPGAAGPALIRVPQLTINQALANSARAVSRAAKHSSYRGLGLIPPLALPDVALDPYVEDFTAVNEQSPNPDLIFMFFRKGIEAFMEDEDRRTQNILGTWLRALDKVEGRPEP